MDLQARNRKETLELIYALKNTNAQTNGYNKKIEKLIRQYELERKLDELIGRRRELQLLYERLAYEAEKLREKESRLQNVTRCNWNELQEIVNSTEDDMDVDMISIRMKFNYNDSFKDEREIIHLHYSGYPGVLSLLKVEVRVEERKGNVINYQIRFDLWIYGSLFVGTRNVKVLDTTNVHIDFLILSEDRTWYTSGPNSVQGELDVAHTMIRRKVRGFSCMLNYDANIKEGDDIKFDDDIETINIEVFSESVEPVAWIINLKDLIQRVESRSISVNFEISVGEHLWDDGPSTTDEQSRVRGRAIVDMWRNKVKYEHAVESKMIMKNRIGSEVEELTERVDAELVAQEQFILSTMVQTMAQLENVIGDTPTYVRISGERGGDRFTAYSFNRFIVRTNYSIVRETTSNMIDGTSLKSLRLLETGVSNRNVKETTTVTGNQLMDEIAFIQIYADSEIRIIVRARMITTANSGASGWIGHTSVYRTPVYTANPLISVEGGMVHRLRMIRQSRGDDGKPTVIRMPVAPTRFIMNITGVYLMSNRSISYVIEASADVDFKVHVADKTLRIRETLIESTELTVNGMRLFGVGADVDYSLVIDTGGSTENLIYLSAEIGLSTLNGEVSVWINANATNSFSDSAITNATGITVNGSAPTTGGATFLPGEVQINVTMTADVLYRLGLIETGVRGILNVGDTGKAWYQIDSSISIDDSNTEHMRRALFNEITAKYEMRIQVPPTELFVRRAVDEHSTIQNLINSSLEAAINDINNEVANILDYVDYLSTQMDNFIRAQEEPWWMIFVNATLEIGLGILIPGAGTIMAKGVSSMLKSVGTVRRIYNATLSSMRGAFAKVRYTGSKSIGGMSIASNELWIDGVMRATRRTKKEFMTASRPMFQNGNMMGQKFDAAERIDVQSAYKFGLSSLRDENQQIKTRDRISINNENMLPTLEVYARPLGERGGLGNVIYDIANAQEKMTRQYKGNITKIKGRQPAHSFMVYTDVEAKMGGGFIVTKRYLGVGELTATNIESRINTGIGGVRVKYEVMRMRTSDGKNIISPLGYSESGYSADQVDSLFSSLFQGEVNGIDLPPDMKWEMITRRVDQKILNSDRVANEILTTGHGGSMMDELLNNPPVRPYNLLTKNCQHFVRDVSTVLKGLPPASTFDTEIYGAMSRARTVTIMNDLGISEVFSGMIKSALSRGDCNDVRVARKLISNVR
ncbi:Cypovirus VP2 [Hubei lepidoptera virus 3]|uniref:Cypovirus VP2 n=1 Tax=Hubei lepidoptera virus 3 TaxID=1922905 RepID=UPI00090C7809|nr:Cypovirus VP2 [Hubei lepidoptera virus 3]APG79095.1 Cypovirus VP2 [Hubei lepidoptera virus 3]